MRGAFLLTAAVLMVATAPWPAVSAALVLPYAEQITALNAGARLVGGSDANGGLGDWALGNGVLCAVISDPSHESSLSNRGGTLVDLVRCGVAHDEWNTVEALLNMSRDQLLGGDTVRAEPNRKDGSVAIVVGTRVHGLSIETAYVLARDRPDVLQIETRATRLSGDEIQGEAPDDSERAFLFGDVVLHGRRQLAPFTLALGPDGREIRSVGSVGFVHPAVDPDDTLQMLDAILPANLHVLLGGDRQRPGIAYGLRLAKATLEGPDGPSGPLPFLAINGESFTMHGVFTRPFWFGGEEIGLLELAQTLFMDIEAGETLVVTREIRVGGRSDVASVTDQLWPDGPLVRGRVEPSARVHVAKRDGTPVTHAQPDAAGAFSLRLPTPGAYTVRVVGTVDRQIERAVDVGNDGVDLGTLGLPETGAVALPSGSAMRLVFVSERGGPAPDFGDDLLGFRVGEEDHRGSHYGHDVSLGGVASDPGEIALRPGRYRVVATRGPEFDLRETQIDVAAGEQVRLDVEAPLRVLEHPGWISADLHVHTEWSDDSNFAVSRQLAAFAAESADLIVSTEHDRVVDYAPEIARMGLSERMVSLVGVEVTSSARLGEAPETAGHANVFPVPFRPLEFRGGAPRSEGLRPRSILAEVRALPGARIVQLNHPRSKSGNMSDLNYFTHLGVVGEPFRPMQALTRWPNRALTEADPTTGLRDLDFDVIELLNGSSMRQYRAVRSDWYSLLLQGEFRPAVANSDSHVADELVGYPRTYVRAGDLARTKAGEWSPSGFVESLRAGRAYGSTGPLLDLELVSHSGEGGEAGVTSGIGDVHPVASGRLSVAVRAAPWVPVSELRVWQNGREIHRGPIEAGSAAEVPVTLERDGFLTVEVSGEAAGAYAEVAPGFVPFAFSNPIFVDADGDGRYTAPGLPAEALPILDPLSD